MKHVSFNSKREYKVNTLKMWIIQTSLNENDQLSAGELDFSHSKQSCVDVMWWNQREKTQNYWKQAKCKASKMHYDLVSWASNFGNFWVTWGSNLRILFIKIKHGSIEILHMIHDNDFWYLWITCCQSVLPVASCRTTSATSVTSILEQVGQISLQDSQGWWIL